MMRAELGLAVILAVAAGVAAQAPPSVVAPAFAVASVRPVRDTASVAPSWKLAPGRYTATAQTLQQLVTVAYALRPDQVTGGDGWTRSDRFTIAAVCSGTVPVATMRIMLQALLARRFGLRVRREQRTARVYVLAIAKGGAKLAGFKEDGSIPPMPSGVSPSTHWINFSIFTYKSGSRELLDKARFRQATPAQLAQFLAHELQATVLDKTGMTTAYNFGLIYAPARMPAPNTQADPTAPSLAVALQEQLGLSLTSKREPVSYLNIVSAHQPTAN